MRTPCLPYPSPPSRVHTRALSESVSPPCDVCSVSLFSPSRHRVFLSSKLTRDPTVNTQDPKEAHHKWLRVCVRTPETVETSRSTKEKNPRRGEKRQTGERSEVPLSEGQWWNLRPRSPCQRRTVVEPTASLPLCERQGRRQTVCWAAVWPGEEAGRERLPGSVLSAPVKGFAKHHASRRHTC